jgi:hypothetical protein
MKQILGGMIITCVVLFAGCATIPQEYLSITPTLTGEIIIDTSKKIDVIPSRTFKFVQGDKVVEGALVIGGKAFGNLRYLLTIKIDDVNYEVNVSRNSLDGYKFEIGEEKPKFTGKASSDIISNSFKWDLSMGGTLVSGGWDTDYSSNYTYNLKLGGVPFAGKKVLYLFDSSYDMKFGDRSIRGYSIFKKGNRDYSFESGELTNKEIALIVMTEIVQIMNRDYTDYREYAMKNNLML